MKSNDNFSIFYKVGQNNMSKTNLLSVSYPSITKPWHIFLTGNAGCGKSFLMKVVYQALTKTLSYGNGPENKPKKLLITFDVENYSREKYQFINNFKICLSL